MNIEDFIQDLSIKGIQLWVEEDRLQYRAPKDVFSEELRNTLKRHKADMIRIIGQKPQLTQTFPLTQGQQGLWFFQKLVPESSAYNIMYAARLQPEVDLQLLKKAIDVLTKRHPSLRTTYTIYKGVPVQQVHEQWTSSIDVTDGRAFQSDEVNTWIRAVADQPFDLTKGPIFRTNLLLNPASAHGSPTAPVFVVTLHQISGDFWSFNVIIDELCLVYKHLKEGTSSALPSLPWTYRDYVLWERDRLSGPEGERLWQYWKQQLEGELPVLRLPIDYPRPGKQTYNTATYTFELDKELVQQLKAFANTAGTTLYVTILAAFQVLLYRYSGQTAFQIGTPLVGRTRQELERIVGQFANPVVLRAGVADDPSFRELMGHVRSTVMEAIAHQDYPFSLLLKRLNPHRDPSYSPLFQVDFVWIQLLRHGSLKRSLAAQDDVILAPIAMEQRGAPFDLALRMLDTEDIIGGAWTYNTALFHMETIIQMTQHFQMLLKSVAENPDCHISAIPFVDKEERKQLIRWKNIAVPDHPYREFFLEETAQSIVSRFEKQVAQYPEKLAVQGREANDLLTYTDLNQQSNHLACVILNKFSSGPSTVALLCEHATAMFVAIMGALKAGKIYVPLDHAYPVKRLHYMLEDSESKLIIATEEHIELARELEKQVSCCLDVINLQRVMEEGIADNVVVEINPDQLAYILYTSGSTGEPKGVMQSHRNVLHHIRNYTNNLHISAEDRLTLLSSYSFDSSVMAIYGALLNGATVYPFDIRKEGLRPISKWLTDYRMTIWHSTPTVYRHFLNNLGGEEDFSSVRMVVMGGEEVFVEDVERYKKHFPSHCIFINGLGPTESTLALQYFITKKTFFPYHTVPIGYPVEGLDVMLLNQAGQQVCLYGIGEIVLKGSQIALGYLRKPEQTAAAFSKNPNGGQQRIYRTGDMGRLLPDGSIAFMGRKDFQVKIRGLRVELHEIEANLREHPIVKEVAVVTRKDSDQQTIVVAYIGAGTQNQNDKASDLRKYLKQKLPNYMIPSGIVILSSLPRTPNGKVDRNALPLFDSYWQESKTDIKLPKTYTEKLLGGIWADLLSHHQIGVDDDFFDLGGHSLLATQMITRVRDTFNVEMSLRTLFDYTTLASLGKAIEMLQWISEDNELALCENEEEGII